MISLKLTLPMAACAGLMLWPSPALTQLNSGFELENVPPCFMVGNDGQLINLSRVCQPSNATSPSSASRATNPAYEGVSQAPAANLGGLVTQNTNPNAPPCFGLDAQGRPCR